MRFDPSFLDEIRARVPVSQVVARRVKLRRQGREFVGLSPFKQEKTPSFTVSDKKGFYHCFASGEHGDIFTFLMKTEGASFPEAVERLAQEAGLPMPERRPGDAEREAYYQNVFEEFIKFKVENNEPIDNFTYEKFAQKLRANTTTLMKRPDVKDVQFSVYLKDGKVALKARVVRG